MSWRQAKNRCWFCLNDSAKVICRKSWRGLESSSPFSFPFLAYYSYENDTSQLILIPTCLLCFIWIFSWNGNDGTLSCFSADDFHQISWMHMWSINLIKFYLIFEIIPASESILFTSSKAHLLPVPYGKIYKRLIKREKTCERAYYALVAVSDKTNWYHMRIQFTCSN